MVWCQGYGLLRLTKSGKQGLEVVGVLQRSAILKSIAGRRAAKAVVNKEEAKEIHTRHKLISCLHLLDIDVISTHAIGEL
jgi:hypothetical protein